MTERVRKAAGRLLENLSHITDSKPNHTCICAIHEAVRALGVSVADLRLLATEALKADGGRKHDKK